MKKSILLYLICFYFICDAKSQEYSIVIRDGHVIDPKNNIDGVMDIAIADGKIAQVAKNIDPKKAVQVVNAKGLYVMPGLIDIHNFLISVSFEVRLLAEVDKSDLQYHSGRKLFFLP